MNKPQYTIMDHQDYAPILALWKLTPEANLTQADDEDEIAFYLARNLNQSFVCRVGAEIVGTILCGNDGRRAFIYHLAVHKDYRKQGIGRHLVGLAIRAQKAIGIERVVLFVKEENKNGIAFWKQCGFAKHTEIDTMSIGI